MSINRWTNKETGTYIWWKLLSCEKEHVLYESVLMRWKNLTAYYTEWSQSEREKQIQYISTYIWNLEGAPQLLSSKESSCNTGDTGLIPGLGRSLGRRHGNILQDSYWENSMDRGAWQAMVHEFAKSWTWLKQLSRHTCNLERWYWWTCCRVVKEMQT